MGTKRGLSILNPGAKLAQFVYHLFVYMHVTFAANKHICKTYIDQEQLFLRQHVNLLYISSVAMM
jgi:hypothetical protein